MREAYLMLIGAATFDKLDGALARRLGLTEPLPEESEEENQRGQHHGRSGRCHQFLCRSGLDLSTSP
jgi:hypothetical protein